MKTRPDSTIEQFKQFVRQPFTWLGCYPLFAIMSDGGCLCRHCAESEAAQVIRSTVAESRDGWRVAAITVNWEDTELTCDHCGNLIESAYGE